MTEPARILVVDDDPSGIALLVRFLEEEGYEVLRARDGYQAVEVAGAEIPDLVLLDVVMPGRSGLEVCSILKGQPETASIPVLFVTALSDPDQVLQAFSVGGCDCVTKPFRPKEVLARVSVHVRLRQAEQELRAKNQRMKELTQQLTSINAELETLSRTDPLTKLLNRRTWGEAITREHERFLRHEHAYSIVMIDVDHFKSFNDSSGHQAGDECLRRIADAIASTCRQVDSIGRYGGEEFVVLAPETQAEAAVKLAERIRRAVWALAIPHPGNAHTGRVTVSLGVALSAPGSWEEVLRQADDALYVAKKAGRNMVFGGPRLPLIAGKRPERAEPAAGAKETPPEATVLVVDDEPTNRVLCRSCLTRAGYAVREAENGHKALADVAQVPPDVILMDVMMPEMDGLECTRQLKGNPDTRDIPVVIVSALTSSEDVRAGLEAGADEYLTKPIRTTELALRVRSMVRLYRERTDLLHSYEVRGEHMRILVSLVDFCRAIGTSRRIEQIMEHSVAAVSDVVRCRRVSIMLPDPERKRLTIAASLGIDEELAGSVQVPIGDGVSGKVFASGRAVVINDEKDAQLGFSAYDSPFFASVPLLAVPLAGAGTVEGVLNVTERCGGLPFEAHELEYIELIGQLAATAMQNISSRVAREQAGDSIMVALAKLAEHRDNDTGLHLDRVTRYCVLLSQELRTQDKYSRQIDDAFMYNLVRAVPLHDIGKVAIPDSILLHPGRLSDEQMAVMRTHSALGAKTIQSLIDRSPGVDFLHMAADIARYHHERFDGKGYPAGLAGEAIPLSARIASLADVYDALTTKRVYKDAFSHDKALTIIAEGSGSQFDPEVVEAFLTHADEFRRLAESMADQLPEAQAHGAEFQTTAS